MTSSQLVASAESFAKQKLKDEGTGHDWWHLVRVINTAKKLHREEGGRWEIIHIALLLHDIGDRKVINQDEDDYTIARDFLTKNESSSELVEHIMTIITSMSYSKSFERESLNDSIEFKIVQDADRLDAMGAIGIARAFTYGGSKSILLYDPDYKVQSFTSGDDYKKASSSTIHHFYEKLLLLKSMLNTKAAKEIAENRDSFMRTFLDQFYAEWDGIK